MPSFRPALAAFLAALMLSLQACGGGGGGGDDGPSAAPESGSETPAGDDDAPSPDGPDDERSPDEDGSADDGDPVPEDGASSSAAYDCGLTGYRAEVLRRLNEARAAGASCGARGSFAAAGALAWNDPLTAAAQGHSADMAAKDYFSHVSQDGRTFTQRIEAAGYAWSSAGENIAAGQRSVQAVVDGWMASDGHCANIMGASFRDVGMACVQAPAGSRSAYGWYWTLNLARPR